MSIEGNSERTESILTAEEEQIIAQLEGHEDELKARYAEVVRAYEEMPHKADKIGAVSFLIYEALCFGGGYLLTRGALGTMAAGMFGSVGVLPGMPLIEKICVKLGLEPSDGQKREILNDLQELRHQHNALVSQSREVTMAALLRGGAEIKVDETEQSGVRTVQFGGSYNNPDYATGYVKQMEDNQAIRLEATDEQVEMARREMEKDFGKKHSSKQLYSPTEKQLSDDLEVEVDLTGLTRDEWPEALADGVEQKTGIRPDFN